MNRLSRSAALGLAIAALAAPAASAQQDLRSPDTRDYAAGRGTFNAPEVTVVRVPADRPRPAGDGIDWSDAGIGAGAALGLVLLAFGGATAVVRTSGTSRTA
jgi:hypothetical protein